MNKENHQHINIRNVNSDDWAAFKISAIKDNISSSEKIRRIIKQIATEIDGQNGDC